MNTTFDTWLTEQFAEGLVDIKLAVLRGKGVSVEAIQDELLTAEIFIKSGFSKEAPRPTSMVPADIFECVKNTVH